MIRLIVVCETRASSKTDYKYIKSVIDYYYKPRSCSIKPIYATSKPELIKQDKKIEKEINDYPGQAIVVLFADVDLDDNDLNNRIISYCNNKKYELVWMNGTIEEVFLGRKISNKQKTKEANKYLEHYLKILPALNNLDNSSALTSNRSSNIILVLDKILDRK